MMNRTFKTISHTALVALLLAGASGSVLAKTIINEPEISFYPAKTWAIEKSTNSCAIKNQFNNGFLIDFNGTDKWVQGMNIDFQQNVFEKGQSYDVTLNVPGVRSKTFKAQASNTQALAVNMRKDKEFYKALRTASVLDMSMMENEFRFYLTGFSQQAQEFERCMAGATMPEGVQPNTQKFAVNEAKAMEQQEKTGEKGITVSSKDLKMSESADIEATPASASTNNMLAVNAIPYSETTKVGEQIISKKEPNKRFSEQLAEQIKRDPSLVDIEPQKIEPLQVRKALDVPDDIAQMPLVPVPMDKPKDASQMPAVKAAPVEKVAEQADATKEALKQLSEQAPSEEIATADRLTETNIVKNPDAPETAPNALVNTTPQRAPEVIHFDSPKIKVKPDDTALAKANEAPKAVSAMNEAPKPAIKSVDAPAPIKAAMNDKMQAREITPAPVTPLMPTDKMPENNAPDVKTASVEDAATIREPETFKMEPSTIRTSTPSMKINKQISTNQGDFRGEESMELRKQVMKLESMTEQLKAENQALNKELNSSLREGEEERLDIASDNWNLEQATMRYNEAERQLKRMAQQLQGERAKAQAEKRELETMLFDPTVTDQAQLARLAELSNQLQKTQDELRLERERSEERIRALQAQAAK